MYKLLFRVIRVINNVIKVCYRNERGQFEISKINTFKFSIFQFNNTVLCILRYKNAITGTPFEKKKQI